MECKEDLQRDEDIFAEKLKELKSCRKQIRQLEGEKSALSLKNKEFSKQIYKLTKMSTKLVRPSDSDLVGRFSH